MLLLLRKEKYAENIFHRVAYNISHEDIFKAFSCNGTLKGCVSQELQKGPKDSMQALINATEPEPRKLHV